MHENLFLEKMGNVRNVRALSRARLVAIVSSLQMLTVKSAMTTFKLPSSMLGTWAGTPDDTPIGPFEADDQYRVGISQADNGDYLIDDNLV